MTFRTDRLFDTGLPTPAERREARDLDGSRALRLFEDTPTMPICCPVCGGASCTHDPADALTLPIGER